VRHLDHRAAIGDGDLRGLGACDEPPAARLERERRGVHAQRRRMCWNLRLTGSVEREQRGACAER
jgi:hypothetical protein